MTDNTIDNSWLYRPAEVDFFYNWIPSEEIMMKKNIYVVILYDFLNPINKTVKGNVSYIAWRCRFVEGFDGYNLNNIYLLSFPIISFKRAISVVPFRGEITEEDIMPDKKYDCMLSFRRYTKKKLKILRKELIETPEIKEY